MPAGKLSHSRLRMFNFLLFLNICLLSLGLFVSFIYVDDSPLSTPRLRQENVGDHGRFHQSPKDLGATNFPRDVVRMNSTSAEEIKRPLLTKAVYPLTLTAPFIIENPAVCAGNVTVLIIVHTSPEHFHRRSILRQSFGNVNLFKTKYFVRVAFFLGQTKSRQIRKSIEEENAKYNDVVLGDFLDSYHNLTLKGVLAFRWITLHCSHAKFVVKIDDDIYVNIFAILEQYVPTYSAQKYQILCNKMYPLRIIRYRSKWRLDDDLFRGHQYYPPFCSGFTVFMTTDLVRVMYKAAHITPVFWVDDVYLFGLLPSKFNISHVRINKDVSLNLRRCELSYNSTTPDVISCTAPLPYYFEFFWNRTLATISPSMRGVINHTILAEPLLARVKRLKGKETWPMWNIRGH